MKVFSLGLVFSPDHEQVLLLQKRANDPYTPGAWNGVGGHVEIDETPAIAINREVFEEAGLALHPTNWSDLGNFSDGQTFRVHVFAAVGDLSSARQKTDEPIQVFNREQARGLNLADGIDRLLSPWLDGGRLAAPRASWPPPPARSLASP